jgi:protein gp37
MKRTTNIAWTEHTWNPAVGCSIESRGCSNCYAMIEAARVDRMQRATGMTERKYEGLTYTTKAGQILWTGKLRLWERELVRPLNTQQPALWFVNSMGDIAHEDLSVEWFKQVWDVMVEAHRHHGHIFQALTKRPANLRRLMEAIGVSTLEPGIWLGVSAEDEEHWDKRVPILMTIPAVVRFVSVEPQLELIDRIPIGLDWVIQGGESGKNARLFDLAWARMLRDRCVEAGVAFFLKQIGDNAVEAGEPYQYSARKGDEPAEWPADLHIRQWPRSRR